MAIIELEKGFRPDNSRLRMRSGYWYDHLFGLRTSPGTTTLGPAEDIHTARAVFIPNNVTLDRIAIEVTTADAGAECRLGIYSNVNSFPGSLLLDSGLVDVSGTGGRESVISISLLGNRWYWITSLFNTPGALAVRGHSDSTASKIPGMGATTSTDLAVYPMVLNAIAFGALPASFGTPTLSAPASIVRIAFRIA